MNARIAIVGAGPAGCATALALAAAGVDGVTVIEAGGDSTRPRIGESVSPEFARLLDRLGLLAAFRAQGHSPCHGSCSSWGDDRLGFNDFIVSPHGHGWHLDRMAFDRLLLDRTRATGVRVLTETRLHDARRESSGRFCLTLHAAGGKVVTLQADQVVDAGGVQALLASRLGARKRLDDRLVVLSALLAPDNDEHAPRQTLLEACEYGWWYAARVPDGRWMVALATDADAMRARGLAQPASWYRHLRSTRHLGPGLLPRTQAPAGIDRWLAASSLLQPCAGPGWLAVGDAASCYDPISAHGLYKALETGLAAAQAIVGTIVGTTVETIAAPPSSCTAAIGDYVRSVERGYDDYLAGRRHFYALERRWPDAPFWRLRGARRAAA
ncbi:MAG: FAD-dependent monooxygenase [Wenzhouxiangellaceae bacterium]